MMILVRWGLLLCSVLGYTAAARRRLQADFFFLPISVLSAIALLVYVGGLAGILLPTALAVFAGGLWLFVMSAAKMRAKDLRLPGLSLFQLCFCTGTLCFLLLLQNMRLEHYDNFSHWGIVVKEMLSSGAFPTAQSALIDFTNYPLGISSFLYYVCTIVGPDQSVMLIGQSLLIFACFYAMFGVITEKKRFLLYAFSGAGYGVLSVFNITIRINSLLVDFLLPVMTLSVLAAVYRYRKDRKTACILAAPVLGLLTVTKSTGPVYAGMGWLYLTYMEFREREDGRWFLGALRPALMLFAFLPHQLWSWHMQAGFQGVENKFQLSAQALRKGYEGKTPEELLQIAHLFFQSALDLSSRPAMGFLIFHGAALLACGAAYFILRKPWATWKALLALDAAAVLYYLGILGLYLFSMPLEEAIRLAGFERYASSITVLAAGGVVMSMTVDMENSFYIKLGNQEDYRSFYSAATKKCYQAGVLASMAVAVSFLLSEYNGMAYLKKNSSASLPAKVEAVTGDRWYFGEPPDESRYLLYASDRDGQITDYYLQYVARYFLYAPNVDAICAFYEDNLLNLLKDYDYLVIVESDQEAKRLMKTYFKEEGDEGIYPVEELLKRAAALTPGSDRHLPILPAQKTLAAGPVLFPSMRTPHEEGFH